MIIRYGICKRQTFGLRHATEWGAKASVQFCTFVKALNKKRNPEGKSGSNGSQTFL